MGISNFSTKFRFTTFYCFFFLAIFFTYLLSCWWIIMNSSDFISLALIYFCCYSRIQIVGYCLLSQLQKKKQNKHKSLSLPLPLLGLTYEYDQDIIQTKPGPGAKMIEHNLLNDLYISKCMHICIFASM